TRPRRRTRRGWPAPSWAPPPCPRASGCRPSPGRAGPSRTSSRGVLLRLRVVLHALARPPGPGVVHVPVIAGVAGAQPAVPVLVPAGPGRRSDAARERDVGLDGVVQAAVVEPAAQAEPLRLHPAVPDQPAGEEPDLVAAVDPGPADAAADAWTRPVADDDLVAVVLAVEDPPLAVVVPADLRVVPRGDEAATILPAEPEVPDARDAPRAGVVPADQDHERVTPVVPGAPVGEEVVHPVQHGALAAGVVVAHPAPQPVPHPSITFCPL